ncbi:MAG: acetoin utilization protein AcuC [Thermoplasmata archaeon]|nr:acetoin utilization protein AcuC [Thermoplasmata archaeon]
MAHRCSLRVIWDPAFERYDFGPTHPFTEKSRWMAVRLMDEAGLFDPSEPTAPQRIASVPAATRKELLRFHREDYLSLVEGLSERRGGPPFDAGDTPSFPGCYAAAASVVGGTLAGVRLVRDTPSIHAFNPAGGLHHAHPGRASGFCIFNDLAVGIWSLQEAAATPSRVAYIDIDVHHGDGVMYGFYDDGAVLDIDFHQDGRTIFPGTGFPSETGRGDGAGLKVNIPLPPETGDEAFIPLFEQIVPTMVRSYRPDLIILQCGMDAHIGDRLGGLQYTPAAYLRAVDLTHSLAHELCGGRLVVTGGGGYTPENVSRGLARVAGQLGQRSALGTPGQPLPSAWRQEFAREFGHSAPRTWDEGPTPEGSLWTPDRSKSLLGTLAERLGVRWDQSEVTPGEASQAPG